MAIPEITNPASGSLTSKTGENSNHFKLKISSDTITRIALIIVGISIIALTSPFILPALVAISAIWVLPIGAAGLVAGISLIVEGVFRNSRNNLHRCESASDFELELNNHHSTPANENPADCEGIKHLNLTPPQTPTSENPYDWND